VSQSVNGQPTLFYSDFTAQGSAMTGQITVSGSDDDFIGFVLGYQPGDTSNSNANYLLNDWKGGTQSYNFGSPSASGGGTAEAGLAVSRVTGTPDADEFWQHRNLSGTPASSGVEELARANTLGSTGWSRNTTYDFTFDFGPNNLDVYVDNVLQFSLAGAFADGRLGFYNFSQAGVTYAGFTADAGSYPSAVPLPAAAWLFGSGLIGLAGLARRRRASAPAS